MPVDARAGRQLLSRRLRGVVLGTAVFNLVVGFLVFFEPELGVNLWPSEIAPVLERFVGSIIFANGVAAWLIVRRPTWEAARITFYVAGVYGAIWMAGVLYHLLAKDADSTFWWYALVDGIFLGPIAYIIWSYERGDEAATVAAQPQLEP